MYSMHTIDMLDNSPIHKIYSWTQLHYCTIGLLFPKWVKIPPPLLFFLN